MQTSTAFNHITIDSANRQKSKFGLAHDVNTTASIGDTQPLACRLLVPKSKTTLSMRHLIRLAPMVVPTYGRLKAKCWSHFVGFSDLLPRSAPSLLTKAPIAVATATGLPQVSAELPHMPLCDVASMCLVGASFTVYFHDPIMSESPDSQYTHWRSYDYDSTVQSVVDFKDWVNSQGLLSYGSSAGFPGYNGGLIDLGLLGSQFGSGSLVPLNSSGSGTVGSVVYRLFYPSNTVSETASWEPVSLASADYVFRRSFVYNGTTYEVAIACRLSAFGKRIRKILIGLGYQINFSVSDDVNVLPIFAYYKAYWDSFGLTLYDNWESSAANSLLTAWDAHVYGTLVWSNNFFRRFVYDLGTTFVTEQQDYISAHQATDTVAPGSSTDPDYDRGFVNNIVLNTPNSGASPADQTNMSVPQSAVAGATGHVYINRVQHTEVDAELLKVLYKWTNRQTVAGKRIKELLEAGGYGDYVKNCKSNFIGYEELEIDVTDVNATADSSNAVTGHNSVVGEYVGKGVGVTNGQPKTLTYENDEFGYWVTLFAICPESGYCQGLDPILLDYDVDHLYNSDFDGKGMELEPKSIVLGSADWNSNFYGSQFSASFGMVPRHSKYKVEHNKLNGDFSLRSVRSSYQPYTLDKVLSFGDRECKQSGNPSDHDYFVVSGSPVSALPIAGNSWRYLNRYHWLSNFERIFTEFSNNSQLFERYVQYMSNLTNFELYYQLYDHFVCMNIMDMVTYAPMLPIADSYGTTDENNGKGDTEFTKA